MTPRPDLCPTRGTLTCGPRILIYSQQEENFTNPGGDIFSDFTARRQSPVTSSISSLANDVTDIADDDSERIEDWIQMNYLLDKQ